MKPTLIPTPKQHLAWQKLQDNVTRFIGFGGGAGGGKSWLGAEWMLTNCYFYPGFKGFIGREELSRLMKSTFVTFQKVCFHHKIPRDDWKLDGKYNYIEFRNGSRIDLLDLAYQPRDSMWERFGSLEYTQGWIEEAGEIKFGSFDVLKSRVGRHMNKEFDLLPKILLTYNPSKNWLYKMFYKQWKEKTLPTQYSFIQSLYMDNPHTAKEYGLQLSEIKDKATKERLMFGNWEYDDDPNTMIDYDAILDLFSNTVEEESQKYMIVDVARFGVDKTVLYIFEGLNLVKIIVRIKQGTDVTSELIIDIATKERIPFSHILVDEDGIGGGVVDQVKGIKGFIANSSPIEEDNQDDKPNYQNLKAQCTYKLAEYINEHSLAINATIDSTADDDTYEKYKEMLIEELEVIKRKDADQDIKLKIIGKDEIKEVLGRSPDYCLIAGTKILTTKGYRNIENININDKVITPFGIRKVLRAGKTHTDISVAKVEFSNGKYLVGTLGHKIYTKRGFHTIDTLMINDRVEVYNKLNIFLWKIKKSLFLVDENIGFRQMVDTGVQMDLKHYIEMFGKIIIKRKFRKVVVSIILMAILPIIKLTTWSLFLVGSIVATIEKKSGKIQNLDKDNLKILTKQELRRVIGTKAKKDKNGIKKMAKTHGKAENKLMGFVKNVVQSIKHISPLGRKHAVIDVGRDYGKADVYNLTIDKDNVYYANGILVSNSDTLMMRMFFEIQRPKTQYSGGSHTPSWVADRWKR